MRKQVACLLFLFVLGAWIGCNQASSKNPPTVSADDTKDLIIDYQTAFQLQTVRVQADQAADAAVQAYYATEARIAKKDGFPDGTHFNPDAKARTVTPVLPTPAKANAKPSNQVPSTK